MHFPTILLAATALCVTSASAGCFNTGEHWGNHDVAKSALQGVCVSSLTGDFKQGQTNNGCGSGSDRSYKFQITNNGGERTISQEDCESHIGGIIDTCGHGGDLTVDNVYYRGDPNKGGC